MSMILWLLCIQYLIIQTSSEIFTTGVGLFTTRSERETNSGCHLLQKQAGDVWWRGGFHNCISFPWSSFGLDWQIIPFRIEVNTEGFYDYPEYGHDVEQYAFINKNLNAIGKQCVTVTGSNWWIEKVVHNLTYDLRMYYNYPLETLNPSVCSTLSTLTYDKSTGLILGNCSSKPTEKTGSKSVHQIQLTINIYPDNLLLSESLLKSIHRITRRINPLSDHCVFVTDVLRVDFGRVVDIRLQFMSDINVTNGCALLIKPSRDAYILSGILTCEGDVISYKDLHQNRHEVRMHVQGSLNGISLNLMSNAEIALRLEAHFNFEKIGCINFEPVHTASILRTSEKPLVSYLSGPSSADICNRVIQKMRADFHKFYKSCVHQMGDSVQAKNNRFSYYRLEAHEPFYEIDELLYLEKHAQLVYELNKPYLSCEYNGYTQMEQLPDRQSDGRN